MLTNTGAPAYVAPEIQESLSYDEKVDLWSAGGVLYFMLFGEPPFPQTEAEELC